MADTKTDEPFNVFISWSGNRSKQVAQALRDWLPMVLQAVKPFLSKTEIEKGRPWARELAGALEVTKVGIVVLTAENLAAPWLLFESGALSKTLDKGTLVCTYLVGGLRPEDVAQPLGQFQATRAEREDTAKLLHDVNKALGSPVSEKTLNGTFAALWPKLEADLAALPQPVVALPPKRDLADMVAENLDLTRSWARRIEEFEAQLKQYLPIRHWTERRREERQLRLEAEKQMLDLQAKELDSRTLKGPLPSKKSGD